MGRPQIPIFPNLTGYTMPIVIQAIDKLGPPSEIAKLPPNQQGPMLVTLAGELAVVTRNLIIENITKGHLTALHKDLREIHGGSKYRELLQTLNKAESEMQKSFAQISKYEKDLVASGLAKTTVGRFKGGAKTKSALAGTLTWDSTFLASTVNGAMAEYRKLSSQYITLVKRVERLSTREQAFRASIENQLDYQVAKKNYEKQWGPRFSGSPGRQTTKLAIRFSFADISLGSEGAIYYLRNSDADWWTAFANLIERQVQHDASVAPAHLMLRDKILHDAIPELVAPTKKGRNDAFDPTSATQEILAKPALYNSAVPWPSRSTISSDGVIQLRKALRVKDAKCQAWIQVRAGKNHPMDPYRTWLCRSRDGKSRASYQISKHYGWEKALNELYWCLSRRRPDFPFQGFFTDKFTPDMWRHRTRNWDRKPPDYFAF